MADRAPQDTSLAGTNLHNSYHKFTQGSKLYVIQFSYYNISPSFPNSAKGQLSQTSLLVLTSKWVGSFTSCKPSMQSKVSSLHFALNCPSPKFVLTLPRLASPHFALLCPRSWPQLHLDRSLAKLIDPQPQHIVTTISGYITLWHSWKFTSHCNNHPWLSHITT